MNKRGQMYVLAAVLLCIAIYSVMEVTNKLEMPVETNFDFYVENFKGERAYVVDLGILHPEEGEKTDDLLSTFTDFVWGTGIVYFKYDEVNGWTITNYLGEDIIVKPKNCEVEDCEKVLSSGTERAGTLSFEMGKVYIISESTLGDIGDVAWPSFSDEITVSFDGNDYNFEKPSEGEKIESIIFQNIDKNYVKVVKL